MCRCHNGFLVPTPYNPPTEKSMNTIFHSGGIIDQSLSVANQLLELTQLQRAHINRWNQISPQKLGQHMGVHPIILDLGRSNSFGLNRVGNDHIKPIGFK